MSCDYAVWSVRESFGASEYLARYVAACEGEPGDSDEDPALDALLKELEASYPDIDSLPDEAVDASPWSAGFDRTPDGIVFCCRWSMAEAVGELIRALARKHGLAFIDPQNETVTLPGGTTHKA